MTTPFDRPTQFMVRAAHQFILGRVSQDVTICVGWLTTNWLRLDKDTQTFIVNKTRAALDAKRCGGPKECELWEGFLNEVIRNRI